MNFVGKLILLFAYYVAANWAFLNYRFLPFPNKRLLPSATYAAGDPLLLTPLIEAGQLDDARNRSLVAPLLGDIRSYAGFLTVNKTTKSHLYFWFIPKTRIDYTSAPLVIWLQGGPGCSSLFGLFTENGPFEVTKKGLRKRVHAWTNNYNMLYIDQPVGTGFSFTENNGSISTQDEVGEHLYEAVTQFYKLFSEFKDRDLYIAGESYGGKYVPAIAYKIHTANRQTNAFKIPLKGMMIGNGYSDPENMLEYAAYLRGLGLIDEHERIQLEDTQDKIKYLIRSKKWQMANVYGDNLYNQIVDATDLRNFFDYTRENFDDDDSYVEFLTQDRIRNRIHVGRGKYEACSERVHLQFQEDIPQTVRPWIEELLEHYPMLFYSGQFDIIVAHPLTENFLSNLHWSGALQYSVAERRIWRNGDRVAGYYKSASNLVYVLVRNAGHMVPSDQPKNAFTLINLFIEKKLQNNSNKLNE